MNTDSRYRINQMYDPRRIHNRTVDNPYLTADEIAKFPSVMAEQPASKTSGRYSFIPTTRLIEQFETMGFYPVSIKEGGANQDHAGFQRHLIRFREKGLDPIGTDKLFPEIVLMNSHDAGTSFRLMGGLFRMVCTNGLVVGESLIQPIRIHHVGYTDQAVRDAVSMIGDRLPRVINRVNDFKTLDMTEEDSGVFALNSLIAKHGKEEVVKRNFDIARLLNPQRKIDVDNNLWNVYNRVQEVLVETGGKMEVRATKTRVYRNMETNQLETRPVFKYVKTRGVKAPGESVRLNQELWTLAEYTYNMVGYGAGHARMGAVSESMKRICLDLTGTENKGVAQEILKDREEKRSTFING